MGRTDTVTVNLPSIHRSFDLSRIRIQHSHRSSIDHQIAHEALITQHHPTDFLANSGSLQKRSATSDHIAKGNGTAAADTMIHDEDPTPVGHPV